MRISKVILLLFIFLLACNSSNRYSNKLKKETITECKEYSGFFSLDNCAKVHFLDSLYHNPSSPKQFGECLPNMIIWFCINADATSHLTYGFADRPYYINDSTFHEDINDWLDALNCEQAARVWH